MSDEPKCYECKATLCWDRDGGEWKPAGYDSNVAIRCLDCASLMCGPCAKVHFEESGLLATATRERDRLEGELAEARAENADIKANRFVALDKAEADLFLAKSKLRQVEAERDAATREARRIKDAEDVRGRRLWQAQCEIDAAQAREREAVALLERALTCDFEVERGGVKGDSWQRDARAFLDVAASRSAPLPPQPAPDLRERLAAYSHEAWSRAVSHVLKAVPIPGDMWARWRRQMATAYADLPEAERASDREEADRMLAIFGAASPPQPGEGSASTGCAMGADCCDPDCDREGAEPRALTDEEVSALESAFKYNGPRVGCGTGRPSTPGTSAPTTGPAWRPMRGQVCPRCGWLVCVDGCTGRSPEASSPTKETAKP